MIPAVDEAAQVIEHADDRVGWNTIAEAFDETIAYVKHRVQRYEAATDAAAAEQQDALF
ncbi:hypothetical protein [Tsukamurella hominis]|uniref:hypothetical protein n=1 Tax=Tsukamurella hominis TaxID=1970232 RepID=UPI0039E7B456